MNNTNLSTVDISKLISFTGAMIAFDNKDLVVMAKDVTDKYNNLIVTEEILPEIKQEVAQLNKLVKNLDDQRKSIKNIYNEPLITFENKIKEVTTILNNTVTSLKTQTDIFEQKRKDEKHKLISRFIKSAAIDNKLNDNYARQIILHDKFLNASESILKIKENIQIQVANLLQAQENELKANELHIENERLRKEEELRKQNEGKAKLINRLEIINKLNNQYHLSISINEVKHLNDVDLVQYYIDKKDEENDKRGKQAPAEPVILLTPTVIDNQHINNQCDNNVTTYSLHLSYLTIDEYNEIITALNEAYPNILITGNLKWIN